MNTRKYLILTNEDMNTVPGLFDLVMTSAPDTMTYNGAFFAVPITHPNISMIVLKLKQPVIEELPIDSEEVCQVVF